MKHKYHLGLDLGGTNMVAGVVDDRHNIVSRCSIPTGAGRPIEEITSDMAAVSLDALRQAGLSLDDVPSWGIGMPSYVNPSTNLLVHANNFGWKSVPIYDYLRRYIGIPIYIQNDANCATLGEVLAGAARDYSDVVMLTLGTGVGGGIVLNNRIYAGADNMGAELGHTKLVFNGVECTCGQKGCLESYCSSTALIRRAREECARNPRSLILELCGGDPGRITGQAVFDACKEGDATAVSLIDDYTSRLAAGISTFITIFRPQVIILGGGMSEAGDCLFGPLREKLHTSTFAAAEIGLPQVVKAALGNDAGVIGAAFLDRTN